MRRLRVAAFAPLVCALVLAAVAIAPGARAQERGETFLGKITRVDDRGGVTVRTDAGREVRIRVTPRTEVYFRDAGDRRLFPNPTSNDLRVGMGVEFVYGDGTPDRITVQYVPEGTSPGDGRPSRSEPPSRGSSEQLKVRVQSIGRNRLQADVNGRSETFRLANDDVAADVREGDLVVITVESRGPERAVVRIDSASVTGIVRRVDRRERSVSIDSGGRPSVYYVDDRRVLEDLREGDRIRFEFEERPDGARVLTRIVPRR